MFSSDVLAFASAPTPLPCHSNIPTTSYPVSSTDHSSPITPPNDPPQSPFFHLLQSDLYVYYVLLYAFKGLERKAWLIRIGCLDTIYCLSIFISTCSKSASQLGRLV